MGEVLAAQSPAYSEEPDEQLEMLRTAASALLFRLTWSVSHSMGGSESQVTHQLSAWID